MFVLACVHLGTKAGTATAWLTYATAIMRLEVQMAKIKATVVLSTAERTHLRRLQRVSCWLHPCSSRRAPSCGRSRHEAEGMLPAGMGNSMVMSAEHAPAQEKPKSWSHAKVLVVDGNSLQACAT